MDSEHIYYIFHKQNAHHYEGISVCEGRERWFLKGMLFIPDCFVYRDIAAHIVPHLCSWERQDFSEKRQEGYVLSSS